MYNASALIWLVDNYMGASLTNSCKYNSYFTRVNMAYMVEKGLKKSLNPKTFWCREMRLINANIAYLQKKLSKYVKRIITSSNIGCGIRTIDLIIFFI